MRIPKGRRDKVFKSVHQSIFSLKSDFEELEKKYNNIIVRVERAVEKPSFGPMQKELYQMLKNHKQE